MDFKMSSAICFNLDQSKILSSGNGLNNKQPLDPDDASPNYRPSKYIC